MGPIPNDSDEDPENMYVVDESSDVIVLDENDEDPGLHEGIEDLDFNDIQESEENGCAAENDDEENGYIPDNSKMVFQKHNSSIFCINLPVSCDKNIAVSGGEDDKGFVWSINSGEMLFECGGHKDSVISCGFSHDDKYVMTADMGGIIIVRNVVDGKGVWDFECSDIEWCMWHCSVNVLFAGTTDGEVYMWKIPGGECKIYQGYGVKAVSGQLLANGKHLFVGYEDGIKLWDLKTSSALFHYENDKEAIVCVDTQRDGNLLACGTQQGNVRLFSSPAGKLVATFSVVTSMQRDDDTNDANSIESVAFSPSEHYLAFGSLNGTLNIWDLNTQRKRHEYKHPAGVSHVIWNEIEPYVIITACLDGVVRQWDSRSGQLLKELCGNTKDILDIVLSKDGKIILTAGDDKTARVFER